jgi:hypothetical protein
MEMRVSEELKTWTMPHHCPVCGREGTVTLQEPIHDQSGKNTKFIDATGCHRVTEDGALLLLCQEDHA